MKLDALAQKYNTDKQIGHHGYTRFYSQLLSSINNEVNTLLEIGVGGETYNGDMGASLLMWRDFFPKAMIVGIDIDENCAELSNHNRIHIYIGSQDSSSLCNNICNDFSKGFDIIIDDGSHQWSKTHRSFELYFPHLAPGGYYFIEDIHCTYEKKFNNNRNEFETFLLQIFRAVDSFGEKKTKEFAQDYKLIKNYNLDYYERTIKDVIYHRGILAIKKRGC